MINHLSQNSTTRTHVKMITYEFIDENDRQRILTEISFVDWTEQDLSHLILSIVR